MKKILLAALFAPLSALAQSYPSPTFNNMTVQGTATINSATFTTTPTAPTVAAGTSNTQLATTAFVGGAVSGITPAVFGPIYSSWFSSLPTSLPASAGVFWNNGGVLSKS
ncbi:hypothetical protein [Burkholderia glumae]|uniref:hypothetical protein n=1 Tax=Burkholderia glumae TaxID=337 RepID=UPI002150A9ED|nr:hypothetical protein [Burkholderia glumae]UVS93470.1 hypothetical protein EFP17_28225 [Burkholderia glumae]